MTAKEIIRAMTQLFLPIWGMNFLASSLFALMLGREAFRVSELLLLLAFSCVCVLAIFVFYSPKPLNKVQIIIRYGIHFAIVSSSGVYIMILSDWIAFSFADIAPIVSVHALAYTAVAIFDATSSNRLASMLNKELEEHQKSRQRGTKL